MLGNVSSSRSLVALYGFTMRWNAQHVQGDSRHLMFAFYNQIIPKRAPPHGAPITQLAPITLRQEDGWLLSTDDWDRPFPTIAPYASWPGDKTKASWFSDSYMAHVARAYTAGNMGTGLSVAGRTSTAPVEIVEPACTVEACVPRSAGTRSLVLHEVNVTAVNNELPTSVELWDGDKRLFTVPGPPYRVQITDWPPGVHSIIALATYPSGLKALSRPRTVVVNPPGTSTANCMRDAGAGN